MIVPLTSYQAHRHPAVKEALKQGYIVLSTSPAAVSGLSSCGEESPWIDYRGLNKITVRYPYLLPLVPAALEQLHSAVSFTILDLQSACNLVHIHLGDEWKTKFITK